MDDQTFLHHFEAAQLHPFAHAEHIRMAWLYLRRDGWETGYARIQAGLKYFAAALGQSDKYHETITRFWALLVQHAIDAQPGLKTFAAFQEAFPILFDKTVIRKHYSQAVLWGDEARHDWVEPDMIPMP